MPITSTQQITSIGVRTGVIAAVTAAIIAGGMYAVFLTSNNSSPSATTPSPLPTKSPMAVTLEVSPQTVARGQDYTVSVKVTAPPTAVGFMRGMFTSIVPADFERPTVDLTGTLAEGWASALNFCPGDPNFDCGNLAGTVVVLVGTNDITTGGTLLKLKGRVAADAQLGTKYIDLTDGPGWGSIFGGLRRDQYTITPTTLTVTETPSAAPMQVTLSVSPQTVAPGGEFTLSINTTTPPAPYWNMVGLFPSIAPSTFLRPVVDLTGTLAERWASALNFCPGDPNFDCGNLAGSIVALVGTNDITTGGTLLKLKGTVATSATPGTKTIDLTNGPGWQLFGGLRKDQYVITPTTLTIRSVTPNRNPQDVTP